MKPSEAFKLLVAEVKGNLKLEYSDYEKQDRLQEAVDTAEEFIKDMEAVENEAGR